MSIQPFSNDFARDFERIKSVVDTLEAKLLDMSRTQGSMYDRLMGEANNQFALFCDITDGESGEEYDLTPAFDFYGVELEEGETDVSRGLQTIGAPAFVIQEFSDGGTVKAKNCVDFRFNDAEGSSNLHGVTAPISGQSGLSGQVSILDIISAGNNNQGPGSVLAIFTQGIGGVHVGFYAKNDLAVTCGTDSAVQGFLRNGNRRKQSPAERTRG